jgi:hypothetical protein
MSDYFEFHQASPSVNLRVHRRVLAGLEREGASASTGLLLGSVSPETGEVQVEDFAASEAGAADTQLEDWAAHRVRYSLPAIGIFYSGARGDVQLAPNDRERFTKYFPDSKSVLLLFELDGGKARLARAFVNSPEPRIEPEKGAPATDAVVPPARPWMLPPARPASLTRSDGPAASSFIHRILFPALVVLVGFLVGGAGYWALRKDGSHKPRRAEVAAATPATHGDPSRVSETAAPPSLPPAPPTPSPFEADRITNADVQHDIRTLLNQWKETILKNDLDGHVNLYADSVEPYFTQSRVSRQRVREDCSQMVSRYGKLTEYRISDITVSPSGPNRAIANFRKRWKTAGGRFAGEEREQLRFAREDGGEWQITSEQELKVYWVHRE